jgi:hypothetical protein
LQEVRWCQPAPEATSSNYNGSAASGVSAASAGRGEGDALRADLAIDALRVATIEKFSLSARSMFRSIRDSTTSVRVLPADDAGVADGGPVQTSYGADLGGARDFASAGFRRRNGMEATKAKRQKLANRR